jgi:hypothetical protein
MTYCHILSGEVHLLVVETGVELHVPNQTVTDGRSIPDSRHQLHKFEAIYRVLPTILHAFCTFVEAKKHRFLYWDSAIDFAIQINDRNNHQGYQLAFIETNPHKRFIWSWLLSANFGQ